MVMVLSFDVLIPCQLAVVYGMPDGITRCVYAPSIYVWGRSESSVGPASK